MASLIQSSSLNRKLNGQYAFLCSGLEPGKGFGAIAGTFTAEGTGRITGGFAEVSLVSGLLGDSLLSDASTYSVNSGNRGTMTLNTVTGYPTDNLYFSMAFTLNSFDATTGVASRGRLIAFPTGFPGVSCNGVLAKQDPAAFSTAAISGGYAFGLAGNGDGGLLVANGRFTAGGGALSEGQIDVNQAGTVTANRSFGGTYAVVPDGRGTATLNVPGQPFFNFDFYVVSEDELLLLENDPRSTPASSAIAGLALRQSGAPFAASSLNGPSVFHLTGHQPAGAHVAVGQQNFDGSGSLSGNRDEINAEVVNPFVPFTGSYSVDPDGLGRGMIAIQGDPNPFPIYLVGPGHGFLMSTGASAQFGMFEPQTGGPFDNASFSGDYLEGALPTPMNSSAQLNSLTADGAGGVIGNYLIETSILPGFTGTYDVTADGRMTLLITPNYIEFLPYTEFYYLVSPSKAVGILVGGRAVGVMEK